MTAYGNARLQIGFIGLGRMGRPIARHLAETFNVQGYDVNLSADQVTRAGIRPASSVADVAAQCDTVLLCLPAPHVSTTVVEQLAGVAAGAGHGGVRTVMELSTVGLLTAQTCAARLTRAGIGYIDSPVSGGPPRAAAGDLTLMVAAPTELVERVRPVLEASGSRIFHLGETPGMGQVMKAANNVVSSTAMAITCEAVVAGARHGLDPAQMIEVLNTSTGRTTASSDKFPRSVLPGTFNHGAAGETVRKDSHLFLEVADHAGVPAEVARAASGVWDAYVAEHPGVDFTHVYDYVSERTAERVSAHTSLATQGEQL